MDLYSAPAVRDAALAAMDSGVDHLVLDLTAVPFMDSSGLGVIVACLKRLVQIEPKNLRGWQNLAVAQFLVGHVEKVAAQEPDDTFCSALVHADDSGDRLNTQELVSMAFLLLVAGHETTVNLIGNAVLSLLRNPDQLQILKDRPELIPASAEEFLRVEGPVNLATFRYTKEPVEIGGVTIPENEIVLVSLVAANRDPEKYENADQLDVTRSAQGHVAFGHGIHYCLGAPLARLEFDVALTQLLARFPNLTLAAEPETLEWRDSTLIRGLHTLPVRLA